MLSPTITQNQKDFLRLVKKVAIGSKSTSGMVKGFRKIGFQVEKTRSGHIILHHRYFGQMSFRTGSTPSDWRWGNNLVRDMRHALQKAA